MSTNQRNRIIYQSQALFISPSSTGYHIQSGKKDLSVDQNSGGSRGWTGVHNLPAQAERSADSAYRSLTIPLESIQSANFNFAINRTDINQFGKLARIDSIVMESPTVNLDFNYYLTDGGNERKLGFNIPTTGAARANNTAYYDADDLVMSGYSALSGFMHDNQGNNYFLLVSKEGQDVEGDSVVTGNGDFDVVAIGNGFVSDYSVEASVGSIPTASVTVEAFNIQVDDNAIGDARASDASFSSIPAVNIENGSNISDTRYFIQGYETGLYSGSTDGAGPGITYETSSGVISALRPGDITLSITNTNGMGIIDLEDDGEAHIQSFSLSVPMSRTVLGRLGNTFGYARVIDLPLNMEVSVSVITSEYEKNSNLFSQLCSSTTHDFTLTLYKCDASTGGTSSVSALKYIVKGARLESQTISNSLGDNQTADLTFSCQIGGAQDTSNGLFMEGTYDLFRDLKTFSLGADKGNPSNSNIPTP